MRPECFREQELAGCYFEFLQVLACTLQWLQIDERETELILIAVSTTSAKVTEDAKQCVSPDQAAQVPSLVLNVDVGRRCKFASTK